MFWSVGYRHQLQHFIESICLATAFRFLFILHHIISSKQDDKRENQKENVGNFGFCVRVHYLNWTVTVVSNCIWRWKRNFILLLLPHKKKRWLLCHFTAVVHYFALFFACLLSYASRHFFFGEALTNCVACFASGIIIINNFGQCTLHSCWFTGALNIV